MTTISAGQIVQTQEKAALLAATGQLVSAITNSYMALATNAASGSIDNTWILMSSGVVEPTDTSYGRKTIANASNWNAPTSASPSVVSNSLSMTWGPWVANASAAITWAVLASLATAGIPWIAYLLTTPRTPLLGDSVQAAASAFTCSV